MKIAEYFKDQELACKCGCGHMPDAKSVEMLYNLRMLCEHKIIITSGARCKEYNERIGGSAGSKHMVGAFDCKVGKENELQFIKLAASVGFNGVGFKDNIFVHIDRHRTSPVMWGY